MEKTGNNGRESESAMNETRQFLEQDNHQPSDNSDNNATTSPTAATPLTAEEGQQAEKSSSEEKQNWRTKLRDERFRRRMIKTILICFSFAALGISAGLGGPTFLDLQIITSTNVQQASAFFTAGSVGYVTGSFLGGWVYDLLSKDILLNLSVLGLGVSSIVTPYCSLYWLMVAVFLVRSIFAGVIDAAGNAAIIRIWGNEGSMAMQAAHFAFAFGGVISPLFTEPFLAPRPDLNPLNTTALSNNSAYYGMAALSNTTAFSSMNMQGISTFSPTDLQGVENWRSTTAPFESVTEAAKLGVNSSLSTLGTSLPRIANRSENAFSKQPNTNEDSVTNKSPKRAFYGKVPDWTEAVNTTGPQIILVDETMKMNLQENDDQFSTEVPSTLLNPFSPKDPSARSSGGLPRAKWVNTTFLETSFSQYATLSDDTPLQNSSNSDNAPSQTTNVHYAFIISGIITILASVFMFAEYFQNGKPFKKRHRCRRKQRKAEKAKEQLNADKEKRHQGLSRSLKLCLLAWVSVFYMLYVASEDTFMTYLTTFAVMRLDWSKSDGAMLTSVFWASFASFRFFSIWISSVMSSVQLLTSCCVLMVLSFVGFLMASLLFLHPGIWVFTAMTGASMSAIFPAGLSWTEAELFPVTGRTTAAISLSSMVVLTINQQVLGHLLKNRGAIWLAYVLLGEAAACLLIFLLLLLFVRTRLRHNTRHQHVITIHVTHGRQTDDGEQDTPFMENGGQIQIFPNHGDKNV